MVLSLLTEAVVSHFPHEVQPAGVMSLHSDALIDDARLLNKKGSEATSVT